VVTPVTRSAAPPRVVPEGECNLSPRNVSNDLLDMGSANNIISKISIPMACAVLHLYTGKPMEYMDIMKIHALKPLWIRVFGNECG
jgi:hypothetical protein